MNKLDLEALGNHSINIDVINTALEHIKEHSEHSQASFQAFKGIDEYLTTVVMLIEEIIVNEKSDNGQTDLNLPWVRNLNSWRNS